MVGGVEELVVGGGWIARMRVVDGLRGLLEGSLGEEWWERSGASHSGKERGTFGGGGRNNPRRGLLRGSTTKSKPGPFWGGELVVVRKDGRGAVA